MLNPTHQDSWLPLRATRRYAAWKHQYEDIYQGHPVQNIQNGPQSSTRKSLLGSFLVHLQQISGIQIHKQESTTTLSDALAPRITGQIQQVGPAQGKVLQRLVKASGQKYRTRYWSNSLLGEESTYNILQLSTIASTPKINRYSMEMAALRKARASASPVFKPPVGPVGPHCHKQEIQAIGFGRTLRLGFANVLFSGFQLHQKRQNNLWRIL